MFLLFVCIKHPCFPFILAGNAKKGNQSNYLIILFPVLCAWNQAMEGSLGHDLILPVRQDLAPA